MEIKAAVVRRNSGDFTIEKLELDDPRDNEILVRVEGVGICSTDLSGQKQKIPVRLPAVFGHEGSGVVEKVGADVKKVQPGDHVIMTFWSCGTCSTCSNGEDAFCMNFFQNFRGTRPDGSLTLRTDEHVVHGNFFNQSSFASHCLVTERNVVKVDKDLPLEILGPLGCGILSGVGAVMNCLKPKAGSSIAIFGVGSVGMAAIQAAVACGCEKIIAVTRKTARLDKAMELGATHKINPNEEDPVEKLQYLTKGGVDYSLECAGHPTVLKQAVACLHRRGTCCLVGAAPRGTEVSLDMISIMQGRTIVGSVEGNAVPDEFIPKMIELYKEGKLPFDKLLTFYPLEDINKAVADMNEGRILKAVLKP